MSRYHRPVKAAMDVETVLAFAAAVRGFRSAEPRTPVESVTDDYKGFCALALLGIQARHDFEDDDVFVQANKYLDSIGEGENAP